MEIIQHDQIPNFQHFPAKNDCLLHTILREILYNFLIKLSWNLKIKLNFIDGKNKNDTSTNNMEKSTLLKDSLLLIWNNRNSAERKAFMEKIYASDITFYESDNSEPFVGTESIDNLIQALQKDWSSDFEFILTETPRSNHNIQQISWQLGIPGQKPVATGMDIAIIKDGMIKTLYLFLNQ